MKEIWKDIQGYEGLYQVSNLGNVMSWINNRQHKRKQGLMLKPRVSKHGYYYVNIYKNGERKTIKNHRLVAETFIPNLESKPEVNHKDGNKLNNCVDNLEWVTSQENIIHGINTGLINPEVFFQKRKKQSYVWKKCCKQKNSTIINGWSICTRI